MHNGISLGLACPPPRNRYEAEGRVINERVGLKSQQGVQSELILRRRKLLPLLDICHIRLY